MLCLKALVDVAHLPLRFDHRAAVGVAHDRNLYLDPDGAAVAALQAQRHGLVVARAGALARAGQLRRVVIVDELLGTPTHQLLRLVAEEGPRRRRHTGDRAI